MDLVTAAALALLVLGVAGSVLPALPGAPLSLAGVYLHWWHTGYSEPGLPLLLAFTLVGLLAVAADYLAGAVSARVGGASTLTVAVAAVVGLALLFVLGPLGALLGVPLTVFVLEVRRQGGVDAGARAAVFAVAGMLGSGVLGLLVTGSMLAAFALVVL